MKKKNRTKKTKKNLLNKIVCASIIFAAVVVLSGKIYGNGENMITINKVNQFSLFLISNLKDAGLNIEDLRYIELKDNSDGYDYAYLLNYPTKLASAWKSLNYNDKLSSGYAYILDNGYPFKQFVVASDVNNNQELANQINYLLTQLAIYSFEYNNKDILLSKGLVDSSSLSKIETFVNSANDYVANNSGDPISIAINEALVIANFASSYVTTPNTLGFASLLSNDPLYLLLNLSDDKQFYVSEPQYVYPNYDYKIVPSNSNVIISNETGEQQSDFTSEDAFMTKIPVNKVSKDLSITINSNKNNYSIYSLDGYQSLITLDGKVSRDVSFSIAKNIEIDSKLDLTVGDTAKINANVIPAGTAISWSSNDSAIATVDQEGNVTGIQAGTAIITATVDGNVSATCIVTVSLSDIAVTGVTLNKSTLSLNIEGATKPSETLVATVSPSDATDKTLTWSSDNTSIATVDQNGKVTAVSAGTANITVTTSNGKKATCIVTVSLSDIAVTGVTLNKSTLSLNIEGATKPSETLVATVSPSDATDKTLTWSSDNTAVATVNQSGKVTAVSAGTANITVTTSNGKKATCIVTVSLSDIAVTGVTLNKSTLSLNIEGATKPSETLVATVSPSDATDKTLTWSSDNTSIATVNQSGKVIAVSAGTANITVTTSNGKKATCKVTVKDVTVTSVTLNKSTLSLNIEGTTKPSETLVATINPSDAADKTLTWSSDNTAVATVNKSGKVTAVSAGTANITVTTSNGKKATCIVSVTKTIPAISRTYDVNIEVGDSYDLLSSLSNDGSIPQEILVNLLGSGASWNYGDGNIITVNEDKKLTATKIGSTTISVTSESSIIEWNFTIKAKIVEVESITMKTSTSLIEGATEILNVSFNPSNATNKTLTWTSSSPSVATVDQNGKVTAVSAGTANITVTTSNGKKATCIVSVMEQVINIQKIQLNKNKLSLTTGNLGSNGQLTATITPSNATNQQLNWVSSDDSVVTVDQNGKLTAHKAGKATITVSSKANIQIVDTCNIEVKDTHLYIKSDAIIELEQNQSMQLQLDNTTGASVKWLSSDSDIVKVDDKGILMALKGGTAQITVEATDSVDTFKDTVIVVINESSLVEIEKKEITLVVGKTSNLKIGTTENVSWESSNLDIVTVNEAGEAKALAEGTAVITGKSNGEIIVQYIVTVKNSSTLLDKIIEVPKTAANIPPYVYIAGIGFMAIGIKRILKY